MAKSKREIVQSLARTEEDRMLLAGALDKWEACRMRGYQTATRFLDLRQRALVQTAIQQAGGMAETVFWGGYADAERACCLFFPDYLTAEQAAENGPVALLRAEKSGNDTLTHRDYLGALMGLGLERACIGDILVHDGGAEILVLEEVADFLLLHFDKAGRKRLTLSRCPLQEICIPQVEEREGEGSVASLRLDCVLALIFSLSRGQAQEAVARGLVFVNQAPCERPDKELDAADRITLRGKGRARIVEIGGTSRKGRRFIRYAKS